MIVQIRMVSGKDDKDEKAKKDYKDSQSNEEAPPRLKMELKSFSNDFPV